MDDVRAHLASVDMDTAMLFVTEVLALLVRKEHNCYRLAIAIVTLAAT